MQPSDLKPELFANYPPEARTLVCAHLEAIRQLPLSFLPNLLREVIDYDFKFPAERSAIEKELAIINSLSSAEREDWFGGFEHITLSPSLERVDWVNQPARFGEQESAHLWSTHQQDAFRETAMAYGARLAAAAPPDQLPLIRLGIAIIGQGVSSYDEPLFRNLRAHGTYFSKLNAENALQLLLAAVGERARAHPAPYGHWYVDGGEAAEHSSLITCLSYKALDGARAALLKNMQGEIRRPGMGPEELRTHLAEMKPSDLGMDKAGDPVLDRFQLKILTEGSGTQIFSTTFAQWSAREALRRAQPLTLLVRFAPRQSMRPMNDLLSDSQAEPELDFAGSLVDADMSAYYHWINQQRLPGASQSVFLAWFEDHQQAIVVSPALPHGVESESPIDLGKLVALALS
ncbi:MAG: hypothetical protein WBE38_12045 [Terracidiphilus sp.]|jgi:hypothetical protein